MKKLLISDFSGGQRDERHMSLAANEAAKIIGFGHRFGALRAHKSHEEIGLSDIPDDLGVYDSKAWTNLGEYINPSGDQVLLGKRNQQIWFGVRDGCDRAVRDLMGLDCDMRGLTLRDNAVTPCTLTENSVTRLNSWRGDTRHFDGSGYIDSDYTPSSYVGPAPGPEANTSFGITVWLKLRDGAHGSVGTVCSTQRYGSAHEGLLLQVAYGQVILTVRGTGHADCVITATANPTLTENEWHLLTVTYRHTSTALTYAMYVDGEAIACTASGDEAPAHTYAMQIGGYTDAAKTYVIEGFQGEMGWFSYDAALWTSTIALLAYEAEAGRYGDEPGAVPVTWRPLLANAQNYVTGQDQLYTRSRGINGASECFFQVGTTAYFGPDDATPNDYLMRWDVGWYLAAGKVKTTTANPDQLVFYGGRINTKDAGRQVQTGDQIYFRLYYSGSETWQWSLVGKVIESVNQTSGLVTLSLGYDTTGLGDAASTEGADYVEYVIVRCHKAGTQKGTTCTAADSAGGTWTVGTATYSWAWCYGNSVTGDKGTLSSAGSRALTASSSALPRISGWVAAPARLDVDRVYIYRVSGGLYYLVHTLTRDRWDWPAFALTWDDDNTAIDTALEIEADKDYRDPPPALRSPWYMNDRIWGADVLDPHVLWMSSLNQLGAFPATAVNDSVDAALTDIGGPWAIGEGSADRIIGILPDIGAFSTTGYAGDSVVIVMATRAKRLYGLDRTDFKLMPAFEVGAASRRLMQNVGGNLVWVGQDKHVYAVPAGTNYPKIISKGLWENGIPVTTERIQGWAMAAYDDQYVLCGPADDGTNERFYLLAQDGTWQLGEIGLNDVMSPRDKRVYPLYGADAAEAEIGAAQYGPVYGLFGGQDAHEVEYISGKLTLESSLKELADFKHFGYVSMCWRGTAEQIDGTISLYEAGNLDTAVTTAAFSVPAGEYRQIVKVHLKGNAIMPQLGVAAIAADPAALEWIYIEGDAHK